MIVVLDDRPSVTEGFVALFRREGVAACGMDCDDVPDWLATLAESELAAVEAFIVGEVSKRQWLCRLVASRTRAVLIATIEKLSLDETLDLFASGVDDVVRKPIHVREIMARIRAAARRGRDVEETFKVGDIQVFCDGRDPLVAGAVLPLPRRERRILEFLASKANCRVSKTQIFHAVYGLFNEDLDENVVESHLSKLRKRLRSRLGYEPIDSKRYLGYRLIVPGETREGDSIRDEASFAQTPSGLMLAQL